MIVVNCGNCGGEINTYPSVVRQGKGKYCNKACMANAFKGHRFSTNTEFVKAKKPHNYKGWRYHQARKNGKKYKEIFKPEHPNATSAGYVREHRLVMEKLIGRYLKHDEIVDHINGDTLNNSPDNLRIMLKKDHDRMNTPLNVHKRWVDRGRNTV